VGIRREKLKNRLVSDKSPSSSASLVNIELAEKHAPKGRAYFKRLTSNPEKSNPFLTRKTTTKNNNEKTSDIVA
jgi:hypothetical protein